MFGAINLLSVLALKIDSALMITHEETVTNLPS